MAVTRYYELFDDLRARILSGELGAEAELTHGIVAPRADARDFARALAQLRDEGLIRATPDGGLTVARPRARSKRGTSFQQDYASQGRAPAVRTVSLHIVPLQHQVPEVVREAYGNAEDLVVEHYHVQSVDDVPHAIARSYVPYTILQREWSALQHGGRDLCALLADRGHPVTEKQETLYVDVPTAEERRLLEITDMPAVGVVRLDCIQWSGGRVVEVCLLCDRADLYEFTYRIPL